MKQTDIDTLKTAIRSTWDEPPDAKTKRYIGKFFDRSRRGKKIMAKVVGNYGTYTVSIDASGKRVDSACNCYIGGGGFCHHCVALAFTFLKEPESFQATKSKTLRQVRTLDDLQSYLKGKTLDSLLQELKAQGITQKAFAESIGMNPRHLSSIRSSELRHWYYNELGATKLACLWVIERFKK
jgi:uncharacterized Zn finger protein